MNPPVFEILSADALVTALVGTNPVRVYPFSEAPEKALKPYVTYSVFGGTPENYITNVPDIDNLGTQVDVWAETATQCTSLATLVRNALEPAGHMTSFAASQRDEETKLYRFRMDFDFFKGR